MGELPFAEWVSSLSDSDGERIDVFLSKKYSELSRARAQKLIIAEQVLVNGAPCKANYKVCAGDKVSIFLPAPTPLDLRGEDIPLTIYYEDEHLVVLEKPAGLVVHPGAGNWEGTLVHALVHRFGESLGSGTGIGGELRPGIVHRIDKNTSGVLVVTRSDLAHQSLSAQFKEHSIERSYTALAWGTMPETGEWNESIGRDPKQRQRMAVTESGKAARTVFHRLELFAKYATLFRAELFTGRTHQIRAHAAHHGFPLVGDQQYIHAHRSGRQKREKALAQLKKENIALATQLEVAFEKNRQFLHASHLGFLHPTKNTFMRFTSPLPEDFESVLQEFRRC